MPYTREEIMKEKKHKAEKKPSTKTPPDHRVKPVKEGESEEQPEVYKIVKRGKTDAKSRRDFLKNVSGSLGLAALSNAISGCDGSNFSINVEDDVCRCHVVCACDSETNDGKSTRDAEWGSVYDGYICTCNTVCTCNSVCTCDTVTTGGGGGGGGYHYWYPC